MSGSSRKSRKHRKAGNRFDSNRNPGDSVITQSNTSDGTDQSRSAAAHGKNPKREPPNSDDSVSSPAHCQKPCRDVAVGNPGFRMSAKFPGLGIRSLADGIDRESEQSSFGNPIQRTPRFSQSSVATFTSSHW